MFVIVRMYKSLYCTIIIIIVNFVEIKFLWVLLGFLSMIIMKFYIHGV